MPSLPTVAVAVAVTVAIAVGAGMEDKDVSYILVHSFYVLK